MRVADLLKRKGTSVITMPSTATLAELLATLDENKIGAVVVVDGSEVVGIVSERDVVHHLHGGKTQTSALAEMMTQKIISCAPEDDLVDLAGIMTQQRFRHIPVLQDGGLVGIISIGDVVKARLDALEAERDALESYLHS